MKLLGCAPALFGDPDYQIGFLHGKELERRKAEHALQYAKRKNPPPFVGHRLQMLKRGDWVSQPTVRKPCPNCHYPVPQLGRGRIVKSAAWQLFMPWAKKRLVQQVEEHHRRFPTVLEGTTLLCAVYVPPDNRSRPDVPNIVQTAADLLQEALCYRNDKMVRRLDLSDVLDPEPECPRLLLWVRPIRPVEDTAGRLRWALVDAKE